MLQIEYGYALTKTESTRLDVVTLANAVDN